MVTGHLVTWVLQKIKKRSPLKYLHFWIRTGPLGMDIIFDKSNLRMEVVAEKLGDIFFFSSLMNLLKLAKKGSPK